MEAQYTLHTCFLHMYAQLALINKSLKLSMKLSMKLIKGHCWLGSLTYNEREIKFHFICSTTSFCCRNALPSVIHLSLIFSRPLRREMMENPLNCHCTHVNPTNIVDLVMGCANDRAGVQNSGKRNPYSNPNLDPITDYYSWRSRCPSSGKSILVGKKKRG